MMIWQAKDGKRVQDAMKLTAKQREMTLRNYRRQKACGGCGRPDVPVYDRRGRAHLRALRWQEREAGVVRQDFFVILDRDGEISTSYHQTLFDAAHDACRVWQADQDALGAPYHNRDVPPVRKVRVTLVDD